MPTWNYQLKIKQLFSRESSVETALKTGEQIAAVVRASKWHAADLKEDDGNVLHTEVEKIAADLKVIDDLEHLNEVLDALCVLANADRVFVS